VSVALKKAANQAAQPYHHGDLRQALLAAALEILRKKGAQSLSLREVARLAGVSAAAPYRHFDSRDSLLAAVAEQGFLSLEKDMEAAALRHPGDARAQLRLIARTYLELAGQQPQFFQVMFGAYRVPPAADEAMHAVGRRVFLALVGLFAKAQAQGRLKRADPESQTLLFWASMHGYAMLLVQGRLRSLGDGLDAKVARLGTLIDLLLDGMEGPASGPKTPSARSRA
jgi:AcrR family transcriptional regulator